MATSKRPPFAWMQPVCTECWNGLKLKIGRLVPGHAKAFCCYCRADIPKGKVNIQRVNPGSTPYPTLRKQEEEE